MNAMRRIMTLAAISESVRRVTIRTGLLGGPEEAEMSVFENPSKRQVIALCQRYFAMDGSSNLRGMAHDHTVWVWSAAQATHGQIARGLGFDVLENVRSYASLPEYCMFHLRGYGFQEGDDDPNRNRLIVAETNSIPILNATVARQWGCTITDGDGYY
jgi:hypothetical protein